DGCVQEEQVLLMSRASRKNSARKSGRQKANQGAAQPGPNPGPSPGRPAPGRPAPLTQGLILLALLLGGALILAGQSARRAEAHFEATAVGPSPKVAFDKAFLGDHTTATRIANVQILDFDRDGKNDIL